MSKLTRQRLRLAQRPADHPAVVTAAPAAAPAPAAGPPGHTPRVEGNQALQRQLRNGHLPSSFHTIVHEAAHAVESKALRDAQFARLQAQAELTVKTEKVNDAVNAVNPESTSAFATAKKYSQAQKKACSAYLSAVNAATSAINTFAKGKTVANLDKEQAAAATAISNRDAAKAKLPAGHPAMNDFAKLSTLQDDWFDAAKERAVAFKAFKAAETAEAGVSGSTKGTSKRLKNFVDLVNKHKIPPLTEYARKNWPAKPGEFFAESYSFWLNDPVYLEANAKPIKDWFDAGEHLT